MTGSAPGIAWSSRSTSGGRTPLLWEFSPRVSEFKQYGSTFSLPVRKLYQTIVKTIFNSTKCQKKKLWDGWGGPQPLSQELTGFKKWPWVLYWAAQKNLQSAGLDTDLKAFKQNVLKHETRQFCFPTDFIHWRNKRDIKYKAFSYKSDILRIMRGAFYRRSVAC